MNKTWPRRKYMNKEFEQNSSSNENVLLQYIEVYKIMNEFQSNNCIGTRND